MDKPPERRSGAARGSGAILRAARRPAALGGRHLSGTRAPVAPGAELGAAVGVAFDGDRRRRRSATSRSEKHGGRDFPTSLDLLNLPLNPSKTGTRPVSLTVIGCLFAVRQQATGCGGQGVGRGHAPPPSTARSAAGGTRATDAATTGSGAGHTQHWRS